ncbi:hypothetical protein [Paenibacillus peoriae]
MQKWPAALFYINGLINTQLLHDSVLRSLMRENEHHVPEGAEPFDYLKDQALIAGNSGSLEEMDITGVYCRLLVALVRCCYLYMYSFSVVTACSFRLYYGVFTFASKSGSIGKTHLEINKNLLKPMRLKARSGFKRFSLVLHLRHILNVCQRSINMSFYS